MSLHVEAIHHFERQEYEQARVATERFLQQEALDHVQFGNGLLLLGCIYCAQHAYEEAERMLATCHGYLKEHLGPTYHGVAAAALNRGIILLERYHHNNAMRNMLNTGLTPSASGSSRSRSPSENNGDEDVAVSWVVASKGHLEEAQSLLEDAYGMDRLVLADVHHNLGCCCEILGAYTDAVENYMRSLRIREKYKDSTGATDLKLALTMEHVAMIYRLTESKLPEAARLLASVAQTRRKYLGPYHPLYANALFAMGVCASESIHRRQAVNLLQRCYEVRERTLGPEHPDTIHAALYLAQECGRTAGRHSQKKELRSSEEDEGDHHHIAGQGIRDRDNQFPTRWFARTDDLSGPPQSQPPQPSSANQSVLLEVHPDDRRATGVPPRGGQQIPPLHPRRSSSS